MIPASFHFLRPEWLLALAPATLLALFAWWRAGAGTKAWTQLVDAHLLRHLALREPRRALRWPVAALLVGWALAALALAGPTWRKLPSPSLDRRDPTVVVLSLAQSMNAADQSPTRLGAARHKVEDILKRMRGGQVGLVIFADRPFVAAPLTEDGRVVGQMLPELATDLMPVLDNRPDLAIAQAVELLNGVNAPSGRVILVTDGPGDAPELTDAAAAAAARAGFQVSVIGVGTTADGPLLAFDGTPVRAPGGAPISTRMDLDGLVRLAAAGGGTFTPVSADGGDIERIFSRPLAGPGGFLEKSGLAADQWADMGPFLLLAVLLMAPLAFRRGWIAVLLVAALPAAMAPTREAKAADLSATPIWRNLWQTPDQQGASAFAREDFGAARQNFQDPAWRASALYKAGDYAAAADAFAQLPGGDYNRGNALAHAGRLKEAIAAYDAALKADPGHADAAYNRNLVQKLLDQQKPDDADKKSGPDDKDDKGGQDNKDDKGRTGAQQSPQGPKKDKPQDEGKDQKGAGKDQSDKQGKPDGPDKTAQGAPPPSATQPPEAKPSEAKPSEAKPSEAKAPQAKPPEAKPPAPQAQGQPPGPPTPRPAPKPAPLSAAKSPPPQDLRGDSAVIARRAQAEQDQTREQMLRMVPDDPAGLLRARIRSHYDRGAPPVIADD